MKATNLPQYFADQENVSIDGKQVKRNIDKSERYSEVGNSQELFWKLCSVKSPEKFETLTEKKMDDVDVGCFSL